MTLRSISAAVLCLSASAATAAPVLFNEITPNPPGSDPAFQSIELLGTAGDSFSGTIITLETDQVGSAAQVDELVSISGTFDANGLLTASVADFENPSSVWVLLGTDNVLSLGDDMDTNDDGILDNLAVFGTIFDAIGIIDSAGDATTFASQLGGTDFAYSGDEPQLMFRDAVSLDLFAINDPSGLNAKTATGGTVALSAFNLDPTTTTFGAVNPTQVSAVPLPSSAMLLITVLGGAGALARRRKA